MTCERSFCKHGRKRSVRLRRQSGLRIFCAHRFIMRGQTSVYTVVSFDFSFTPLFYCICSAPGLSLWFDLILKSLSSKYKSLIRYTRQVQYNVNAGWTIRSCIANTYLCSVAKEARGRCSCCGFFLTQLSRWGFWGFISFGLHSQRSICQATLLIQIIHLCNLFHTSRFNL